MVEVKMMISAERVKEAADKNPLCRKVLEELFPEAFCKLEKTTLVMNDLGAYGMAIIDVPLLKCISDEHNLGFMPVVSVLHQGSVYLNTSSFPSWTEFNECWKVFIPNKK